MFSAYFPRVVVEPSQASALAASDVMATRYCPPLASQYPWRRCSRARKSSPRLIASATFGSLSDKGDATAPDGNAPCARNSAATQNANSPTVFLMDFRSSLKDIPPSGSEQVELFAAKRARMRDAVCMAAV